jgi:hypothetical protein
MPVDPTNSCRVIRFHPDDLHKNCAPSATKIRHRNFVTHRNASRSFAKMNGIIYLVGLVVVVLAILSFFGLR